MFCKKNIFYVLSIGGAVNLSVYCFIVLVVNVNKILIFKE